MSDLNKQIENLELKLLHENMQVNPSLVDELIASDFEEINSHGRYCSRQQALQWLKTKDNAQRWQLLNFRIKVLSDELVLATYQIQEVRPDAKASSTRSSIWRYSNTRWQLVFHQGTKIIA